MTYLIPAVAVIAAIIAIAFFLRRSGQYYDKIFSDEHYGEIVDWLHYVLKLGPVADPEPENNTAFQTSAECALTFTREIGDMDAIHIAISQVGRHTTHAVSNRIAFLILETLNSNRAEADLFYTESTVHHVLLVKEAGGEWATNDMATVIAAMQSYEAPPFRFQSLSDSP